MAKDFTVVIEEGEDGYLISEVLELPGCHTQAKTLDELMKRTKEAVNANLPASRSHML
jgi:predicted RNase H-like HicB family nuclease